MSFWRHILCSTSNWDSWAVWTPSPHLFTNPWHSRLRHYFPHLAPSSSFLQLVAWYPPLILDFTSAFYSTCLSCFLLSVWRLPWSCLFFRVTISGRFLILLLFFYLDLYSRHCSCCLRRPYFQNFVCYPEQTSRLDPWEILHYSSECPSCHC